jgi:hypothetical protein
MKMEVWEGLGLNGTHQFLVSGDDISLLSKTINIMKTYTAAVLGARKKVGIESEVQVRISPPECRTSLYEGS